MHRRLHFCQHILGSVLGFVSEYSKLGFAPFAVGNVSGDLGGAYDLTLRILDRRNGQRNVNSASVLATANGFTMFDAFTAPNTLPDSKLLVLAFRRHQNGHRFSDGLSGRIAE